MKKLKLWVLAIALFLLLSGGAVATVYADEGAEPVDPEQVQDETLTEWFERMVMPLAISAGGGMLGLLIIAAPYLKQMGQNKALQANNKALNVACKLLQSNLDEWKSKAEAANPDLDGLVDKLVEDRIAPLFGRYESMLGSILSGQQLNGEQLTAIRQAATHVWAEDDGARAALAEPPSASLLAGQALQIEFYRQKIAELMGVSAATICADLDKQAAEAVTVIGGDDRE